MNGISLTEEGNLLDARAVKASGHGFAYVRGYRTMPGSVASGKDDQRVSQHKAALLDAGVSYGVFGDFDHRLGIEGSAQAAELVGHAAREDVLPPGVRLWDVKGADGKTLVVSDWYAFANRLSEVCYHVAMMKGRYPVIFANQNQVKQITAQLSKLSLDSRDALQRSWWGVISVPGAAPVLPAPWTKYPFFVEYVSGGQTVSGAVNVALAHWPGSEAELRAWASKPTVNGIPAWGVVDPGLPPVPPTDPIKKLQEDLAALTVRVAALEAGQGAQHTHDVTVTVQVGPAK